MARNYTKKNQQYWENKSKILTNSQQIVEKNMDVVEAQFCGTPFYQENSAAVVQSYNDSSSRSVRRGRQYLGDDVAELKYKNIQALKLPFNQSERNENINIKEAVILCQKAYAGFAAFRNAIDTLAEFSAAQIYITGGNQTSRKFIESWLKKADIQNLASKWGLEYYKSGNVFLYRIDGEFTESDFKKISQVYGAIKNKLPIKYIVLNPADVLAKSCSSFTNTTYVEGISRFEVEKLNNPITEEDKLIFENLPSDVQKKIKDGNYSDGSPIEVPLAPEKIHTIFYKKQDYEPFAIPYGYPVLEDINWKLELKKVDQAVCRTVENIILLVTQGDKERGTNKKAIEALQRIFANDIVSRTLVADYSTKVEFIIPDLKKVLGKEKYEEVDKDIAEGLIDLSTSGDEKFANQQTKISVFLERLKDGQNRFLEFLNSEIKRICKNMNFKAYPSALFQKINLQDDLALKKITLRLIELGVLTADEGIKALASGTMPEQDERVENQVKFKENKDKGLYVPLQFNGTAKEEEPHGSLDKGGRPDGTGVPKESPDQKSPIGQGDQSKASLINITDLVNATKQINTLIKYAESIAKKKYNVKKLNNNQKRLIENISESIVCKYTSENWNQEIDNCINNVNNLILLEGKNNLHEIEQISKKYSLDIFASALIFNSQPKEKGVNK